MAAITLAEEESKQVEVATLIATYEVWRRSCQEKVATRRKKLQRRTCKQEPAEKMKKKKGKLRRRGSRCTL